MLAIVLVGSSPVFAFGLHPDEALEFCVAVFQKLVAFDLVLCFLDG